MAKTTGVVVALSSFWSPDGLVRKGELYAEDDPRVKRIPAKFKPLDLASSPPVEQATAAPGEKRAR